MGDTDTRAVRKEQLRKMFEPMWRDAVYAAESNLRAKGSYVDRGAIMDLMFAHFPQSLLDGIAKETLISYAQGDIELMKELVRELIEQIKKEAMN